MSDLENHSVSGTGNWSIGVLIFRKFDCTLEDLTLGVGDTGAGAPLEGGPLADNLLLCRGIDASRVPRGTDSAFFRFIFI